MKKIFAIIIFLMIMNCFIFAGGSDDLSLYKLKLNSKGSDTIIYYNSAFDSMMYSDTCIGVDSWVVSSDTLTILEIWYKSDTGIYKNIYILSMDSPIDAFEYDGFYHFVCLLSDIAANDFYVIFRRK